MHASHVQDLQNSVQSALADIERRHADFDDMLKNMDKRQGDLCGEDASLQTNAQTSDMFQSRQTQVVADFKILERKAGDLEGALAFDGLRKSQEEAAVDNEVVDDAGSQSGGQTDREQAAAAELQAVSELQAVGFALAANIASTQIFDISQGDEADAVVPRLETAQWVATPPWAHGQGSEGKRSNFKE